jgi:hypothetical protein
VRAYTIFLTIMCALFAGSATVLLVVSVAQVVRRRRQRAFVYLGLTLLACVVAAGFYFFQWLI